MGWCDELHGFPMNYFLAKQKFDNDFVHRVLRKTRGNVAQAAKLSGMNRNSFYDLLKRTSIDPEDYRRRQAAIDTVRRWFRSGS